MLELGAGTGRVALAPRRRAGSTSSPLDARAELLDELAAARRGRRVEVETVCADARELDLGRAFARLIAPMQLMHLLGGERGRAAALRAARAHLDPGGRFAAALLADETAGRAATAHRLLPDVRELDGWVCSSLPLEVAVAGDGIEIRRLRQLVSPGGELTERTAPRPPRPAHARGFRARGRGASGSSARERIEVPPTADHVGSVDLRPGGARWSSACWRSTRSR